MSFFLNTLKPQSVQQPAVSGMQLQSSAYGKAVPIVYGTTTIAPNLLWYGDFRSIAHQSQSARAGKGGAAGGGGGGKGGGGSTSYTYQASLIHGLCEGPITGTLSLYVNKNISNASALGFSVFNGSMSQTPWGYLSSLHAGEALGYRGTAYMAAANYDLGNSPQLPNHNVEVAGLLSYTLPSFADADPSLVVADFLSNNRYGCGFPAARIGDLSVYQAYAMASGLWVSLAVTEQRQASEVLDDLAEATHSAFVWSEGVLRLVPYGDEDISGNGYSYNAPAAPLYDLTDDDFLSGREGPVMLTRARAADAVNAVRVECLSRFAAYNPAIVEAKDEALIAAYGLRAGNTRQMHCFADVNAARRSAQLMLQRSAVRNRYRFTLDQRFMLLDPMDIVTLTDSRLGLDRQWVRILSITEDENGAFECEAEDYLKGSGHAPLYSQQAGEGYAQDYNQTANGINEPVIFEPTALLAGGLEVWIAASGDALWGGADVYASFDDQSYRAVGRIEGGARTGRLAGALASVPRAPTGTTLGETQLLSVDVSESRAQLLSGSKADALGLATLCYVDGEYIAYETATLTGTYQYDLHMLVRGALGSAIGAHAEGSAFARLDDGVLGLAFAPEDVGRTLYVKFVSYNIYGAGQQNLADVQPYAYTITGSAYAGPLPDIASLRTSYAGSITQLTWDEVEDFRPVQYEIRKGAQWAGAQLLTRVAHPPVAALGDGTYWVAAYSRPLPGIEAYSANPQNIIISGAQITSNVIASHDEAATGWGGTLSGAAAVVSGAVRTAGMGDILDEADYLAISDIINYGGTGSGIYEIPAGHRVDIGRVAACGVIIGWESSGQQIDADILSLPDYLVNPDILNYAASMHADVYPEIALSDDGANWGSWQKYAPGFYMARAFKARMQLSTDDPTIIALLSGMTFTVDVPDRNDHYVNLSLSSAGETITFTPNGAASPAAFNGGPDGGGAPAVQVTILNAAAGDIAVISSVSLSSCHVQVLSGGVGVARSVNLLVQGY